MRIYMASKLSARPILQEVSQRLWAKGHEVVSTWVNESGDYAQHPDAEVMARKISIRDMCQICTAELVILDTTVPLSFDGGGGREFEYGFATAQYQYKKIWRVGPAKSAFHYFVDRSFETWNELVEAL